MDNKKKDKSKVKIIDNSAAKAQYNVPGTRLHRVVYSKEYVPIAFSDVVQWFKVMFISCFKTIFVLLKKGVIRLKKSAMQLTYVQFGILLVLVYLVWNNSLSINFALNAPFRNSKTAISVKQTAVKSKENLATYSLAPAEVEHIADAAVKAYVQKYGKVAVQEMEKYGILASIKMAQALIESRAGDSRLARESNNHFGIKCKRKCKGCTCRNYTDDDIYDMFRVFESPLDSYRAHSLLLSTSERYSKLKTYGKDYKKWAAGLKSAGYATDKTYDKKLIRIIDKYKLYKLDNM